MLSATALALAGLPLTLAGAADGPPEHNRPPEHNQAFGGRAVAGLLVDYGLIYGTSAGCSAKVVTNSGNRLTLGHSLARTAALFAGWELSHMALFIPNNVTTEDPHSWQMVGLSIGTAWFVTDMVSTLASRGERGLADVIAGTRVVPSQ